MTLPLIPLLYDNCVDTSFFGKIKTSFRQGFHDLTRNAPEKLTPYQARVSGLVSTQ